MGVRSDKVLGKGLNNRNLFSFRDVPNGDYVLVVSQGTKFLGVRAIHLPSAFPVVMQIHLFPAFSFPVARVVEY